MSEKEILEIIRLDGRYEVISKNGYYSARPIMPDEILISERSHKDCKEHFSNPER